MLAILELLLNGVKIKDPSHLKSLTSKRTCALEGWTIFPLFLSLAALLAGGTEDQTLAALLSSGKTALFKLSKEGKRILWISDKIRQSSEATNIG